MTACWRLPPFSTSLRAATVSTSTPGCRYRIFGARNPSLAYAALQKDARAGVLLPCNVVLYETDDGKAVVGAVDPMRTLAANAVDAGFTDLAREIGARLERVVAGLTA
jgi:uncharacterized protein (DUF302 family)